jgi:3-keto-5-aminohexanoate cleavage enzyme
MGSNHAHYAGALVDGAKMLELFGDVATELCIRADGDEGLFRAYDAVEFLAPVRAGDFIEAEGTITRWGKTSLGMEFVARKVIVPTPRRDDTFDSSADLLPEPIVVCRARGTCVVPENVRRKDVQGRPAPCIVTAAIVGAETTRAQNPHLPLSADELAAEAERCAKAGASVIHLHVRDDEGRASQEGRRFREAIRKIRARTDVIIQTSTGGAVGMSVAERAGPLECVGADAPEMATLNVGTINFGEDVFMNKAADTADMARRIRAHGAMPEGALSASERNLEFLVERMETMLPAGCTWGVAGVGRHQLPMVELAAMWGGNARVGLEDNIWVDKGVLAEGSAPLVARAVELCERHGRKVATVDEARALLGVARPS